MEKQLRSWAPRTPSPRLKARLFGQTPESPRPPAKIVRSHAAHSGPAWHWLAPTMAVFMLGLFLSVHGGLLHHLHAATSTSLFATASLTQPEYSTYYASVQHSENNTLRNTFEWTNGNSSLSTAPPMAPTNSVRH